MDSRGYRKEIIGMFKIRIIFAERVSIILFLVYYGTRKRTHYSENIIKIY